MDIVWHHFPTLLSTNSYGKEHLADFATDALTIICAEFQEAGRGRFGGRKWVSPAGQGLTMSFVFFIDEEQEDPFSLTHLLALSVIELLEERGVVGGIKWPNDVMVDHKKIAGILCETVHRSPHFGVVVGLGLNVNVPSEVLEEVGQPATSLLIQTGVEGDREEIRQALVHSFSQKLELFLQKGFAPFLTAFRKSILKT